MEEDDNDKAVFSCVISRKLKGHNHIVSAVFTKSVNEAADEFKGKNITTKEMYNPFNDNNLINEMHNRAIIHIDNMTKLSPELVYAKWYLTIFFGETTVVYKTKVVV